MRLVAVLLFTVIPLVTPQFLNPSQRREVWRIGETKKVTYNTKLQNYTIALWQQAIAGGSAQLGPIIVDTTDGPKRDFEWKVDLEMLDLGASNVFFFWLFEGDKSMQGEIKKGRSVSSAFFNITDEPAPKDSLTRKTSTTQTVTSKSSTISSSSTISLSSAEQSTTDRPVSSTAAIASSSTAQDRSTPAATEPGPTDKTKVEDGSPSSSTSPIAEPAELPVGAQAGIGIGVGLVGVTCIVFVVLWYRYLKRKSQTICELQGTPCLPQKPPGYSPNRPPAELAPESPVDKPGYYVNRRPVEIACD